MRGITKRLDQSVFSNGTLPRGRGSSLSWRGARGGRRRGTAVDAQLTRLVNTASKTATRRRSNATRRVAPPKRLYVLTRMILRALASKHLVPVRAQRVVVDASRRLATAADVVAVHAHSGRVTLIEVKCGYTGVKDRVAYREGHPCNMKGALSKAPDTAINRHFAQLAVTKHMFVNDVSLVERLVAAGVNMSHVDAAVLYADEEESTFCPLPEWWDKRGHTLMQQIA